MPARDHLLQIQRNLYDRFRSSARQSVGNLSPSLRKYFLEYQREFVDYKGISSRAELLRALQRADISVCGDYHTLPEAQRTVLRLLSESVSTLKKKGRRPVLALEMLKSTHDAVTRRFLDGSLNEEGFLEAIDFHQSWGFPWENYRPLFQFAREYKIPIVGLNTSSRTKKVSLQQRDRFAAEVLAGIVEKDPKATVFALIGDLHLARTHLPSALQRQWKRGGAKKVVVLHQNAERLYWKLASRGLEHEARVLKLGKDSFCVMNTPPWVKLQSYLRWLEWTAEHADAVESDGEKSATPEFGEEFADFVKTIQAFLGFSRPIPDGFEIVWGGGDLKGEKATRFQREFRRKALKAVGSYFTPEKNRVFLATPSVNAGATQAAIFLHSRLSGRWRDFEFPRQDFYPTVWIEALGFLGSKIINPHRRCYGPRDFRDARDADKLARIVHEHLEAERRDTPRFEGVSLPARASSAERAIFYYRAARCLGQVLGSALYSAVVMNAITFSDLRALFRNPFSDHRKSRDLYLKWVLRLDKKSLRDSIRRDRW